MSGPRTSRGQRPSPRGSWLAAAALSAIVVGSMVAIRVAETADGTLTLTLAGCLIATLTGVIILAKRPGHGIGRLLVTVGMGLVITQGAIILMGIIDPTGEALGPIQSMIFVASEIAGNLALVGVSVLLIIWFPDGRRTSRLGGLGEVLLLVFLAAMVGEAGGWAFSILALAYAIAILDLLQRYRRAEAVRKAQIRWVLATAAISATVMLLTFVIGDQIEFLWSLMVFSMLFPAIGVVIALTRYHLYDIDRIVSNTVGYGLVTVLLFGVFWAVNLALQNALVAVTGAGGPFAVAGSTLLVAALFNPVRVRVQVAIDRRFHRARYDAGRLATTFASRLRDELDLDHLATELTRTTAIAVEPTTASIWLRSTSRAR